MKDEKSSRVFYRVLAVILTLAVTACLTVNILTVSSVSYIQKRINTVIGQSEDVAREDDVVIANEYTIKSTKQISDAYISGDSSKLNDMDKETLQLASDVIKDIIKEGSTDYEKELAVYEWLCDYASQDEGLLVAIPTTMEYSDCPYGVLKYRSAVCVGYATTFRLFMQMLNIECMVVHDSSLGHSWNLVKIENEWYHTDVFTDAGTGGNHDNFNMNDAQCLRTHNWNTDFYPAANGLKFNYAAVNSIEVKNIYDIPQMIKAALDEKRDGVYIKFGTDFSDAEYQVVNDMLEKISSMMWNNDINGETVFDYGFSSLGESEGYILSIKTGNGSDGETKLDDETINKINFSLTDAFGEYNWSANENYLDVDPQTEPMG